MGESVDEVEVRNDLASMEDRYIVQARSAQGVQVAFRDRRGRESQSKRILDQRVLAGR